MDQKYQTELKQASQADLLKVKQSAEQTLAEQPDNADAKEVLAFIKPLIKPQRGVKDGVKVKANEPLAEVVDGEAQRYEKDEVFTTTEERAKALGKAVTRVAVLAALLFVFLFRASAQEQYGPFKTLCNLVYTNNPGGTTNIANIGGANTNYVTVTRIQEFLLHFEVGLTNASTGTIDVNWQYSADAIHWDTNGWGAGWFSIPLTNGGTYVPFDTNIVVSSVGYYRLTFVTNNAGQHWTNFIAKAYAKPDRWGLSGN